MDPIMTSDTLLAILSWVIGVALGTAVGVYFTTKYNRNE